MAYNNVTDRADLVFNEETIGITPTDLTQESAARALFRTIPVSKAQQRFPLLGSLPVAYWVAGDTGLKQTTEMAWTNKFMNMEEIAVIVPVPQNVLDDSDFDVWGEVRPAVQSAVARTLDAAIFFGTNAPASFPTNVLAAARAAANTVDYTAAAYTAATGGIYRAIDETYTALEADGYSASGWVAQRSLKGLFRAARNSQGDRQDRDRVAGDLNTFDGDPIRYALDQLWPARTTGVKGVYGLVGDWAGQFILGIRKDITFEVFREGVITDNTGAVILNLMQQDAVAMRVTFRAGWQVANPINYVNSNSATRYPAAVLQTDVGP